MTRATTTSPRIEPRRDTGLLAVAATMTLTGLFLWLFTSPRLLPATFHASITFLQLAGAALYGLARFRDRPHDALPLPTSALVALGGLSITFALGPHDHVAVARATTWVGLIAGAIVVMDLARITTVRRELITAVLATAGLLALHGLAQRIYLFDLLRDDARAAFPDLFEQDDFAAFAASKRARSTFGQANGFSGFLSVVMPFAVAGVVLTERKMKDLIPAALLLAVIGVAFVASESKGGALTVLATIGAMLVSWSSSKAAQPRRFIGYVLLGLAAMSTLAVANMLFGGPSFDGLDRIGRTAELRLDYWSTAWRVACDHPWFGVGLGHYGDHAVRDVATYGGAFSRFAHNGYLTLAAEVGFVVTIGVVVTFIGGLLRAFQTPAGDAVDHRHGQRDPSTTDHTSDIDDDSMLRLVRFAPFAAAALAIVAVPDAARALFFVPQTNPGLTRLVPLAVVMTSMFVLRVGLARPVANHITETTTITARVGRFGVLAFLLHAAVDFDLYVDGVTTTVVLLGAATARPRRRSCETGVVVAATILGGIAALRVFTVTGP